MNVRWMVKRDFPKVLRLGFESEKELVDLLKKKQYIAIVCEDEENIVGVCVYELEDSRYNLVKFRTTNYHASRELIQEMKNKLSRNRRHIVTIDVKDENLDLQLFLKDQGFVCTKIIENRYRMEYELSEKSGASI